MKFSQDSKKNSKKYSLLELLFKKNTLRITLNAAHRNFYVFDLNNKFSRRKIGLPNENLPVNNLPKSCKREPKENCTLNNKKTTQIL